MKKAGIETPMALFAKSMIEAKEQGIVKENINPGDVILNMISMILFPVVAKHMVKYMHNLNDVQYRQMIEDRKAVITQFIIQAIKA